MSQITQDTIERTLGGELEERFLTLFFVLYKTSRIIDSNNDTFKKQSDNFYNQLRTLVEQTDNASIKLISGRFFVNEKMVRFDDRGVCNASTVTEEWDLLGIGGIEFSVDISKEEMDSFFVFFAGVKPNSDNYADLSEQLKVEKLLKVTLLAQELDDEYAISDETRKELRKSARKTFFNSISAVKEVVLNTIKEKDINISKTRRVVHTLIDQISRDESSMLELAAIKNFDDYTYAHSTNVAVYALTVGVRLELDRSRLSQLGFAALFHDIGKVKLPTDLIRKPDAYDENDWIQMQRHPLLGAKTILRTMKFDTHVARAARGAFEHHINMDYTGYPRLRYKNRPFNLFSKIISIVDTFDALTSGRVYIKKTISTEDVLKKMQFQMGNKFDKFILKMFTDIIGAYPVGSLVLLNTDEIAMILSTNENDKARPFVKVVGDRDGLLETGIWIDLAREENYDRKIVRKIDPEIYGLDIKDFILED
jgi:HD-GYP domain-containing protein (c-di-GMP phosphodiesterase class II)